MRYLMLFLSLFVLFASCSENDSKESIDCSSITCSNHGQCEMVGGTPRCRCEFGYVETNNKYCLPIMCSSENPNGKCLVKEHICQNGECIVIPIENKCNSTNLNGVCPDNYSCEEGKCIYNKLCSIINPNGSCPYYNQICQDGTCVTPDCSTEYPNGACSAGYCDNGKCTMANMCSSINPTGSCFAFKRRNMICVNGDCEYTFGTDCWECSEGYSCPPASENSAICEPIGNICSPLDKTGSCPSGFKCEDGACVDSGDATDLCNDYEGVYYNQDYCASACSGDSDCGTYQESCEDTNNTEMGKVCLPSRVENGEACLLKPCQIGSICTGEGFNLTCVEECSKADDLCSDANQICYNINDDVWGCVSPKESSIGKICDNVYKCPENALCVDGVCLETCDANNNCSLNNYICKNVDGNSLCMLPDFNDSCNYGTQNACRDKAICAKFSDTESICVETCSNDEACLQENYTCTAYNSSLSLCYPPRVGIGETCSGLIKCEDNAICAGWEDGSYQCFEKCDGTSEYSCIQEGATCHSNNMCY